MYRVTDTSDSLNIARRPNQDTWISNWVGVTAALVGLAVTVLAAATIDHDKFVALCAVTIAMVYGVYLGFAIKGGSARDLVVESLFVGVGLATAMLGLLFGAAWLAIGLALHGLWDLLHHPHRVIIGTNGVPRWYVPFCAVYDFTAAIAVLLIR